MWYKQLSFPTILTLIRLVGSPLILPFFLVYFLPYNIFLVNVCLAVLFFLFGSTDFFDGYLARKYKVVTSLGAMLDHVADKFLLYSTLVALVAVNKLYFFWAILWIGREFFIMALRQVALENNFSVTVSSYGKIKTIAQGICLTWIIVNPYQVTGLLCLQWWNCVEYLLLFVATAFSLVSAYKYFTFFIDKFKES
jgi:CDP-diacylglycerol---glycerol-3-phosphate 3-phosphatidyltransferase